MCIIESDFGFVRGLYLAYMTLGFLPVLLFFIWKVDGLLAKMVSRFTGIPIKIEFPIQWKVQSQGKWKYQIMESSLFLFCQFPAMCILLSGGYIAFVKGIDYFFIPYTQLCYGYP